MAIAFRLIRKRGGWTFVRSWLVARGVIRDEAKERFERGAVATKVGLFERLPVGPDDVLFVGDSLTEGGPWHELLQDARCKNRGIGGDTTAGLLARVGPLLAARPAQVFLMAGVNDLLQKVPVETVAANHQAMLALVQAPTRVVLQGCLPLDPVTLGEGDNGVIRELNERLRAIAETHGATFVDLYPLFERDGRLAAELSSDGLHLNGQGYMVWRDAIRPLLTSPRP